MCCHKGFHQWALLRVIGYFRARIKQNLKLSDLSDDDSDSDEEFSVKYVKYYLYNTILQTFISYV